MAYLLSWRMSLSGFILVLFYMSTFSYAVNVDMTVVTNHPLLDPFNTSDQYIGVYLGQKDANLTGTINLGRIIRTTDTKNLPNSVSRETERQGITKFHFLKSDDTRATGAFYAAIQYKEMEHNTSTVVLMHNATIFPEQMTLTAHINETVNITVITNKTDLRWRSNDGGVISRDKTTLTMSNVQPYKAGVYRCHEGGGKGDADLQAVILLHVIRCPANRWGDECERTCPECLNGGKCDVDSGECVCPPGFNGTACEQILGSNRFGQDGSFSCDISGGDHSPGCRGKLFCLPDPFGCTCAAGFMGIDCTTECDPGMYGANCLQECHCTLPNSCQKDTGECIDGTECQEGWEGVNCQVRLPFTPENGSDTVETTSVSPQVSHVSKRATETPQPGPSYGIASFHYSQVNNGEKTTLVCVVTGSPPPDFENIAVTKTISGSEMTIPLRETSLNETTRTSKYEVMVSLDEMPQNFTCLLRGQDSERVSKELAVYVFEPPSFNEADILVRNITSRSITISWSAWTEDDDHGDGPVIGYRVYYNTHGQNDITRATDDIIRNEIYTITGLEWDTEYDFRLTASRQGPRGEGTYSSVITERTKCIAPSTAPILSVQAVSQTSISLSWTMIPEGLWGCSTLSGIEVSISTSGEDDIPRTLSFRADAGSANVGEVQDCTTYYIKAAFRNKDELGSYSDVSTVSTSMTRPASIESLQTSPSGTQIVVSWQVASGPCPPEYFIIRYSIYQKLACDSPETTRMWREEQTSATSYRLTGLEPYSQYTISVRAVNGAGQSEQRDVSANTEPEAPSTITHVRVNPAKTSPTSIGFTWEPLNCRNVNGEFWYYYPRIYKDGDRTKLKVKGDYTNSTLSISSVDFSGLEPCTTYELSINAGTRTHNGGISFVTGVTGVTVYNPSAVPDAGNQLLVQWTVPSQCIVDYYRLSYQLISRKACPDVHVTDAQAYEVDFTSSYMYTYLSDLEYYATYNISISAVVSGSMSLPVLVSGDTIEGAPSGIESVSHTSTADSLNFVWNEPSCESLHGELDGYQYDLYIDGGSNVQPRTFTRVNTASISRLEACTEYRFRIRVMTTRGSSSQWLIESARTNISVPGMPNMIHVIQHQEDIGITGLTVAWQPPSSPPCQPTGYDIEYYLLHGDSCENTPNHPIRKPAGTVDGSTYTFNILGLRPNSEYMVFVRAKTLSGYGHSNSGSNTTGFSYPSGPPTNIRATATRKRSIVFTWEKPECGFRNGPITSYDVMLFNSTGTVVYQDTVSANTSGLPETDLPINNLVPYSNYSIRIRAWNFELAGDYSTEVWAQTDEAKPAPPVEVTLPSSDQESISVEWMSPNPPLGRIIGYYIFYWETNNDGATPMVRNITFPCRDDQCIDINYRFSVIIPDLKPDTNYSVQVKAETIRGVGNPSPDPPVVRVTSEGIPSAPEEIAVSSTSKSLKITWIQPRYPRGKIISYTLAYKVNGKVYDSSFQPGDFETEELPGANLTFVLENLEPATHYEVYVVASTSKGMGDSSKHVKKATLPPSANELPKPSPPVLLDSPDGLPIIQITDALESPYITHVVIAVKEIVPDARRRRDQTGYGTYAENPLTYIAARISKDSLPIEFSIGDNQTYGGYHNAPLKDKTTYAIRTGVESKVGRESSTLYGDPSVYKKGSTGGGSSVIPVVLGVILAILLLVVVVVGVLYHRKRKGKLSRLPASILRPRRTPPVRSNNRNQKNNVPMRQVHSLKRDGTLQKESSTDGLCNNEINGDDGAIYANLQSEDNGHGPIPLDQLIAYVAKKKSSTKNGFKQDYESIPAGQLHPWDVAKKIENKQKNRYINIIAYDHSRVQLPLLDNDPHSDYINASFIDGYSYPRKYIAAQGPNVASVKDFWRMVWEEDCGKIVMLTNLVEGDKKKCEKYWPDKKMLYGKITVTMNSTEVNTHYTVRTFRVMFDDNIREVVQYHYTSWPDMGVPKYTTPLMNFIRTVKQHHTNSLGPVIVHCSAGVGRTGTFITLDSMLDQAEAENAIDVYNFITSMRQNRIKMVQVAEQYQFIYDALLETFVCGDTSIAQDLYLQRYPSLLAPSPDTGSTLLQEQFERLDMFTIKPKGDDLRAARNPMNVNKNRYHDKIPTDKSRPYLITEVEGGTNYINASFLPGYTKKDMFIGTQTPLPDTVADFWRLIFDYKISTVVMLNGFASEDQSMAEYWPATSRRDVTYGPFTITLLSEEHYDEISCRTMEIRSTTAKSRVQTVYQLQLTTWPMASEVCTSATSIMELHRRAMVWNEANAKDTPILVHCKDGEGATGTFCSLSSVLERLNVERLVDVFQACKRLRVIRPGAVASLDQYEFIHSVIRLYLDSYDIYENYRT